MRDMSEKSIFSRIIDREVPSEIVFENDHVIAFKDIAPQAPVHVLVVPKVPHRDLLEADTNTIVALMEGCKEVAALLGLAEAGFRLIINTGKGGGADGVSFARAYFGRYPSGMGRVILACNDCFSSVPPLKKGAWCVPVVS